MREPVACFRVQLVQTDRPSPESAPGTWTSDYAGMPGVCTKRVVAVAERDSRPMLANPTGTRADPVQKQALPVYVLFHDAATTVQIYSVSPRAPGASTGTNGVRGGRSMKVDVECPGDRLMGKHFAGRVRLDFLHYTIEHVINGLRIEGIAVGSYGTCLFVRVYNRDA